MEIQRIQCHSLSSLPQEEAIKLYTSLQRNCLLNYKQDQADHDAFIIHPIGAITGLGNEGLLVHVPERLQEFDAPFNAPAVKEAFQGFLPLLQAAREAGMHWIALKHGPVAEHVDQQLVLNMQHLTTEELTIVISEMTSSNDTTGLMKLTTNLRTQCIGAPAGIGFYGVRIRIPDDVEEIEALDIGRLFNLKSMMLLCHERGYQWLALDADGPVEENLPYFE
ncbi:hypothetical protein ACYPKM_02010 [Pseudomonas aeruginosa]